MKEFTANLKHQQQHTKASATQDHPSPFRTWQYYVMAQNISLSCSEPLVECLLDRKPVS
jgi:hypothetical protein